MPTQNVSMDDWVYSRIREHQQQLGGFVSFSAALAALVKVADAHLAYLVENEVKDQEEKHGTS